MSGPRLRFVRTSPPVIRIRPRSQKRTADGEAMLLVEKPDGIQEMARSTVPGCDRSWARPAFLVTAVCEGQVSSSQESETQEADMGAMDALPCTRMRSVEKKHCPAGKTYRSSCLGLPKKGNRGPRRTTLLVGLSAHGGHDDDDGDGHSKGVRTLA